jgi:hypothetical protein
MRRISPRTAACLIIWLPAVMLGACRPAATPPAEAGNAYPIDDKASEKDLLTPLPPSSAPQPAPGQASLSGALYSYTIQRLIPETMFYLTAAEGENHDAIPLFLAGPDPAKGDLTFRSDSIGNFSLESVPPGNYFLVVSAPYNWSLAETSPDDPTPLLIRLGGGDRLALGVVYLSWP